MSEATTVKPRHPPAAAGTERARRWAEALLRRGQAARDTRPGGGKVKKLAS
jgi:hypothetical protein